MIFIEAIILCLFMWGICFINTGSDEKNLRSFRSYPNEVQEIIMQDDKLKDKE